MRRMRLLLVCLFAPLGGCASVAKPLGVFAAVDVAAYPVVGRGTLYSTLSGRDCSMVRLEQGKSYCRPVEPPPARPVFCTRSLGAVDCWAEPDALPGNPREVADGPRELTPAQEADRTRSWPNL
jgi:hypothetical protein